MNHHIKTRRFCIVTSLIIALALLCGCSHPRRSSSEDPRAVAVWHTHEVAFRNALRGYQKNDDFEHACVFFEGLTGIKMHVDLSVIGFLPTPESTNDLARLRAWYRTNRRRIYWDDATKMVRVRQQ